MIEWPCLRSWQNTCLWCLVVCIVHLQVYADCNAWSDFCFFPSTQVCLSGHEPGLTHGQSVDPRDGCRPGPTHQLLVPQTGHRHSTATPPRNPNLRGSPLQWKAQLFTRWVKGNLKCLQGWWKKSLTVFRWLNKKSSICILKYRNRWMNLCL